MIPSEEPVFIVNTGRCGSTLLAAMMRENPDWLVLSEYLSYLSSAALPRGRLSGAAYWGRLSTQSPVLREMHLAGQKQPEVLYEQGVHGDWPLHRAPSIMLAALPFLAEDPMPLYRALEAAIQPRGTDHVDGHMRAAFATLASETGRARWIERTGDSLLLAGHLSKLFPKARFVHLYRDGRDVAASMITKPDFRAKVSYFKTLRRIGLNPYRPNFAYGVAPWHGWVERIGAKLVDVRHFTDAKVTLAECAQHWAWCVDAGLAVLDQLPASQRYDMRYEDLVADPKHAISQLAQFIGAAPDTAWIARAAGLSEGQRRGLRSHAKEDLAAMEAHCSPQLRRLGYDLVSSR